MIKAYLEKLVNTAEKNYFKNIVCELKKRQLKVENFVDIGCYTGENTLLIAKTCHSKNIFGIDLNSDALKQARKKRIKTIHQDISDSHWKIESNTFDFVYSNQTIEHLYSVDLFIKNIKRVLKKNGYALISTENLSSWHNVFSLLLGYQPFSTTNICTKKWSIGNPLSIIRDGHHDPLMIHRSVFTLSALSEFFSLYNFEIIKIITSGYYPFPNNYIGNFFAKIDKRHSVYMAILVKNIK
jgi:SAM-dependent methyltransferase